MTTWCINESGCTRSNASDCKVRCADVNLEASNAPSNHPDERMRLSMKDIDPCNPTDWPAGERHQKPLVRSP